MGSSAGSEPLSPALPFGRSIPFASINGPTYVTAQTLIQQVAYALSDKLFTYSPETFDLDAAVKSWASQRDVNANGYSTTVQEMQTRQGAGNIALGYMFSKDFDLKKRRIPQSVIASSATLQHMSAALEQLSLLYAVANPFVAHIAAVDYTGGSEGKLVSDYSASLSLANELGLALVASSSAHESQHMALFSTLLASYLPTIHIYDGVRVGRETTRVIDTLSAQGLGNVSKTVLQQVSGTPEKHLDSEGKVLNLLDAFNSEMGTDYGLFEYHGHPEATSVVVTFGTVESSLARQAADSLAKAGARVGVVNVRVYRPFVEEEFLKQLPSTTKYIGVLGQVRDDLAAQQDGVHSSLYEDVLAALTFSSGFAAAHCVEIKYSPSDNWTLPTLSTVFDNLGDSTSAQVKATISDTDALQYVFLDVDNSGLDAASLTLGQALAKDPSNNVSLNVVHDNLVQGGVVRTDIRASAKTIDAPYLVDSANFVYVGDLKIIPELDVLSSARDGATILVNGPGVKDEDLVKKLPVVFRLGLAQRGIRFFILDSSNVQESALREHIFQAAFLKITLAESASSKKITAGLGNAELLEKATSELATALREVEIPESWKTVEEDVDLVKPSTELQATGFTSYDKTESEPTSVLKDWQVAANALAFKEAYGTRTALRPDLPTKTFRIHVRENRRLTPKTYDRNIFHIEFDLGDSGLKYDIGEALGIHAENNPRDVDDFIKFYGLNPDEIVEVQSREDPSVLESRTVYQALIHNVDLFGKPPKRFYESLAEFAADEKEKKSLLHLGSAEGAEEFKRRGEIDTLTFADVLVEFPSAHPSFHDIVKIVNPMKRREYSIASCQQVTPNSVALMIVVVNWVNPKGVTRYGQASHYLSNLKPGTAITASVKPSVMKLPPSTTQPIIMAGLGTGLAPFRAFVQQRALEKSQGKEIGSVLLYMGSRHQREEYCYGEEWEAYQAAGVITLLGRAFSRDQPNKVYIQDRMRESLAAIQKAYIQENGAFYLCGPTWPVPDVTAVLEDAIVAESKALASTKKVDSRKEIEKLKEEMRYVLEVY